ncbi:MAG TPA: Uma2 family endonuclease [Solirubrobacteraceae bacterium]|nr:Uma2 family endonuclease [Solirubrobacteraceae bacterium]
MAHAPAVSPQRLHQRGITRDEFEALMARGAFDDESRFELIDGRLFAMTYPSPEHENVIQALTQLLVSQIKDLRVQLSVGCGATSLPFPDLALARPANVRSRPEGARLAIEVVVTQWREAQLKLPVYAEGGVEEYWIVHEPKRVVFVHRGAAGREYTETHTLSGSDLLTVPGTDIAFTVDDLFTTAGY